MKMEFMMDLGFENEKLIQGWRHGRGFHLSQAHYTINFIFGFDFIYETDFVMEVGQSDEQYLRGE